MGAYLSSPVTGKISCDEVCNSYTYGASSMQGWRINQEDAHNCIPEFDRDSRTSMFAVYDGHGGSEVALYCSKFLPDCIKDTDQYKEAELGPALIDAFLKFDSTLVQEDVIKDLKLLAGVDENEEEDDENDPVGRAEADDLRAEADLPLDVLLAKYKAPPGGSAATAAIKNLRKKDNVQSPAVRGKKSSVGGGEEGPSSSSDAGGSSSSSCSNSSGSASGSGSGSSSGSGSGSGSSLANGMADNENNQNKEKELSCLGHPPDHDEAHAPDAPSNSSGDAAASSSHARPSHPACGDSGEGVVDSSKGEEEVGDGGEGVSSSSAPSSSSRVSESSAAVLSDGVTSSSSGKEDDGPSASGIGSSSAGNGNSNSNSSSGIGSSGSISSSSSSSDDGGSGGGAGSISSSNSGGSSKPGKARGHQSNNDNVNNDDDSDDDDEDDDEDEWQDIESGEDDDDDDEDDDDCMQEGEEPMMDMSNEEPGSDSGCTACVALLRDDHLVVANAGDSRCVLCRGGTALELSYDHKPEDDPERQRIQKAGGRVTADGRVNGGLNLSRAIGDHFYKRKEGLSPEQQMITALPDIQTATIDPTDQFFVLACDGIWNSMSSQDCVDFIAQRLKDPAKEAKPSLICEELFDHCLAQNTDGDGTGCDNMTCIIVVLHPKGLQHQENGILHAKRCVRELETTDDSLEKRPRVEEGEEEEEEGKGTAGEGEVTEVK